MKGKATWKSRTFWVNIIAVVALVAQNRWGYVIDGEGQAALLLVVNMVLRACTSEPLSWVKNGTKSGFTRLRLLVVVALLSLAVLTLQGCAMGMAKPTQPGEVLASLETDYTTTLIAARAAHDQGLLSLEQEEVINSLVLKISVYFDRAEASFKGGDQPGQNEWVKLIRPLVIEFLMAVPQ